jgi:CelD/BcsL family acetyltransferase involved in cellulose biosynthesis
VTATALKFQLGARTLASIHRELARVSIDLIDAMSGRLPSLPPLPREAHGYFITSLAEPRLDDIVRAVPEMLPHVRQRYARYHTDLRLDFAEYWGRLSSNTRSQLKRKGRRVAEVSGGSVRVRAYRTADEVEEFHDVARRISARSYQETLMGAGLPDDDRFIRAMVGAAAADRVRAWILTIAGEPAAYLYGEGRGGVLRYDHVGHDPAFNDLSPGSVLMLEAMRDLMSGPPDARRFERFDFTEGEGQHKRAFATGAVPCLDLLLLKPSLTNRLTAATLGSFDRAAAAAKRASGHPALKGLAKKVRRAS